MKIIKFIVQTLIVFILLTFLILIFTNANKLDFNFKPHTIEEVKYKPYTESIEQPKRLPNISDKEYAYRLMSVRREQITDINVLSDYDGVLKTVRHNINNDVGNEEDYQLLNTYNRTNGGSKNE